MLSMDAIWIMLTGSLVAAACAGGLFSGAAPPFQAAGDAISHAVLPGIVIAFL